MNIINSKRNQHQSRLQKKWYNRQEDVLRYVAEGWLSDKNNKHRLLSFDFKHSTNAIYLTAKIDKIASPWSLDQKMKLVSIYDIMMNGEPWKDSNKFEIIMPIDDFLPEGEYVTFLCHEATITVIETLNQDGTWIEKHIKSRDYLADVWINEVNCK